MRHPRTPPQAASAGGLFLSFLPPAASPLAWRGRLYFWLAFVFRRLL
nr:MAG TPA: hypothetical protein [Caudoviricetes sp.]